MPVLSDKWIKKMSSEENMIFPFEEKQIRGDSISYGLSSFGYDARELLMNSRYLQMCKL